MATIVAASPSYTDVTAAIASAVDGDTVVIPAGTATWTTTLTLTKGITLQGQTAVNWKVTTATGASLGVDVATFTGAQSLNVVSTSGFPSTGPLDVLTSTGLKTVTHTGISGNVFTGCTCTAGSGLIVSGNNMVGTRGCTDSTIIQDAVSPRAKLLYLNTAAGKTYRVSGLTFTSIATVMSGSATLRLGGFSTAVRVDHCHFLGDPHTPEYVQVSGPINGVLDHNVFEMPAATGHPYCFAFDNGADVEGLGLAQWFAPTDFGGPTWIFVEDNYWMNLSAVSGTFAVGNCGVDAYQGGNFLIRYNQMFDVSLQDHGTQGSRGCRKREVYNNTWYNSKAHAFQGSRSGPTVSHDNTLLGIAPDNTGISQAAYRQANSYVGAWGCPTLPNHWDIVDTSNGTFTACANPNILGSTSPVPASGSHTYTPVSGLYETVIAGPGSGSGVIVDISKSWTTNKWTYFCVQRLSDNRISIIVSNTGTTLTTIGADASPPVWTVGDHLEIRRYLALLDQPGRGQCLDQIVGAQTSSTVAATMAGVNVNTFTGSGVLFVNTTTANTSTGTVLISIGGTPFLEALVDYTGKTGAPTPSFTGCTARSNAAGVLASGMAVNGYYQNVKNATTNLPTWPRQQLEPSYEWNDFYTPTSVQMKLYGTTGAVPPAGFSNSYLLEGRDFYNGTAMPGYTPYIYPHPLTGGSTGAVITLSGDMTFDNTIVGQTSTSTLTVSNLSGSGTTLNVTSVTYPTGFTGATGAFTVAAGGTHNITVTFSPVTVALYGGNITVASDAVNNPSATIAASGAGVSAATTSPSVYPKIIIE